MRTGGFSHQRRVYTRVAVSSSAWLDCRLIKRKLTIARKILFDHGAGRCVQSAHDFANDLQTFVAVGDFNIEPAKLDGLAFSHLRAAACNLTKLFFLKSGLQRIFEALAALNGLNVSGNANVEKEMTALLS